MLWSIQAASIRPLRRRAFLVLVHSCSCSCSSASEKLVPEKWCYSWVVPFGSTQGGAANFCLQKFLTRLAGLVYLFLSQQVKGTKTPASLPPASAVEVIESEPCVCVCVCVCVCLCVCEHSPDRTAWPTSCDITLWRHVTHNELWGERTRKCPTREVRERSGVFIFSISKAR